MLQLFGRDFLNSSTIHLPIDSSVDVLAGLKRWESDAGNIEVQRFPHWLPMHLPAFNFDFAVAPSFFASWRLLGMARVAASLGVTPQPLFAAAILMI